MLHREADTLAAAEASPEGEAGAEGGACAGPALGGDAGAGPSGVSGGAGAQGVQGSAGPVAHTEKDESSLCPICLDEPEVRRRASEWWCATECD